MGGKKRKVDLAELKDYGFESGLGKKKGERVDGERFGRKLTIVKGKKKRKERGGERATLAPFSIVFSHVEKKKGGREIYPSN